MNKLKFGVLAGAGIAVGYLTLRRFRNRGSSDEAEAAAEIAIEETESAADHAVAAAGHAKRAGEMAVDAARADLEDHDSNGDTVPERPEGRLRRVRQGLRRH